MDEIATLRKNCSRSEPQTVASKFSYTFTTLFRLLRNEGNLVYEYNPFRNLRLSNALYKANSLGALLDEDGNELGEYKGVKLTKTSLNNLKYYGLLDSVPEKAVRVAKPMELVDFTTTKLNFDLKHPVQMECQPSYDGSVNIILNDDKNQPRLINSRFTPLENNTYKIINRTGNNDTNIYDEETFEVDTSLYKRITAIPTLTFNGLSNGGALPVGNYVFYFRYEDADGNMTDFVSESGIVTCHVGGVNDIFSIKGGIKDENSNKIISFTMENIDPGYNYVRVYYTRSTSDLDGVEVTTAKLIDNKYYVRGTSSDIMVTGFETTTDISLNDINVQYNLVNTAKTAAQCQSMLFLGNTSKVDIPYGELSDLSLRIYPIPVVEGDIGNVTPDYGTTSNNFEYYNVDNIYNKLGYWNKEIYRLGVVYILNDYTLSPVFNVRGANLLEVQNGVGTSTIDNFYTQIPVYTGGINPDGSRERNYITINEGDYGIMQDSGAASTKPLENAKGVIRIVTYDNSCVQYSGDPNSMKVRPIGIRMAFDKDALQELKKYVKGFFIVRQKRIPTILAQAFTVGLDNNAFVPLLKVDYSKIDPNSEYKERWIAERFLNDDREIVHDFKKRLYNYPPKGVIHTLAAICPEAEINQSYFSQLFTGGKFTITKSTIQPKYEYLDTSSDERYYYVNEYDAKADDLRESENYVYTESKITLVPDDTPIMTSGTQKYSARAGNAEEAWRLSYLEKENIKTDATNLIRGSFGTYIGIEGFDEGFGRIIDIHIPGYDAARIKDYFQIRYEDKSAFFPITDRIDISSAIADTTGYSLVAYRGDCFIGNYTHRMNRNFQDPEAPNNDRIVNPSTWANHYQVDSKEKNGDIDRGDVNAVKLGHWITFKLCSNVNISMRTTDDSHYEENGLTGLVRAFYPLYSRSVTGESKIPESSIMNGGINSTTGDKYNFLLPDVPYIKNEFDTRIMYSDIYISDAFRNGYRVFQLNHFRDYSSQYGSITKLLEFNGFLVCVFEHGTAVIPVNERALAGEGAGGSVFINTSNVLPENPKMLSSNYGTQWIESVTVTPYHVYGVDTVARKIWRTDGQSFEIISDFKIQQFLNRNITLKERDKTPLIGVRNVSSHYNAYKGDIMFTFYDNLYGFEEKAWNICYNEILGKWITFYSWIPSYSANIDNLYFSFDRNSSKAYSKLGVSTEGSNDADGIVFKGSGGSGTLSLANRSLPDLKKISTNISFELVKDPRGFYKYFTVSGNRLSYKGGLSTPVAYLNVKANISFNYDSTDDNIAQYINGWNNNLTANAGYYQNTIAVLLGDIGSYTTNFWKHGQAGIIDIKDKLKPCFWYGKQHPFEFEVVVADNPSMHKIFTNLYIIANKAKPESFHYEIVGEVYDFEKDKKNMYYRQEATKELYQNLGCDITYDHDYTDTPKKWNTKSTLFPWYYERIDTFDEIYDSYQEATSKYNRDYQNLTGSEIVHEPLLDEYRIATHQKGVDMNDPMFDNGELEGQNRLRGNMQYKEDIWNVEMRPIFFVQKNEDKWEVPPIILNNLPKITATEITEGDLPTDYDITDIENTSDDELVYTGWTDRKSTRIRDKYCKIKVRYSGEDLAVITALRTIYTISYA